MILYRPHTLCQSTSLAPSLKLVRKAHYKLGLIGFVFLFVVHGYLFVVLCTKGLMFISSFWKLGLGFLGQKRGVHFHIPLIYKILRLLHFS